MSQRVRNLIRATRPSRSRQELSLADLFSSAHSPLKHQRTRSSFLPWICGTIALVLSSLVCLQLDFNYATTASIFLVIIVLLSILGNLLAAVIFSFAALGCLSYFFVDPIFTFDVARLHDMVALAAFLTSALFVTGLIWRIRALDSMHREQAQLLDITTDAVIVRDPQDIIIYWNRGAEELYGWSRTEAVGKAAHLLLQTRFPAPIDEIDETLLKTGRWDGELVHSTHSGKQLSVLSRWSRRLGRQQEPSGTIECNTDVTQRRLTEESARRNQAIYLAEAQQLSKTGSFGWNIATDELFWSEQTFRIFEPPPSSIPSIVLVLERVHPDDLDEVRVTLDDAKKNGRPFSLEHRLLMPNSTVKYVRVVTHATTTAKGHLEFIGAVMDVTAEKHTHAELRRSEQRYRHLFTRMPIALRQLDATKLVQLFRELKQRGVTDLGCYFDANPHFLQTCMEALAFHEANERAIQMFGGLSSETPRPSLVRTWQANPDTFRRAMESRFRGEASFEEETKMVTWDGRVIDVLFITARVGSIDDFEMSLVGTLDISERLRAQEAFRKLQSEFAHAARVSMLGEFTASIAHEINQPLAAISNHGSAGLRWLRRPNPDLAEIELAFAGMLASAQRAADIVARIRAMASGQPTERTLICLDDVIDEALEFLKHECQSRDVTITRYGDTSSAMVFGDRTQLQQVIVNLAVNSMQAMEQVQTQHHRITIRTARTDPSSVHCTFEDSGPGITPDDLDHLFDSFFTTKDGGMGMGLPICRSIVEAHGGKISAENNAEMGGAKFSFTLATVRSNDVAKREQSGEIEC